MAGDNYLMSMWLRRSWDSALKICPAFLKAFHSEKPSIMKLVDTVLQKTNKNMSHNDICITVSN